MGSEESKIRPHGAPINPPNSSGAQDNSRRRFLTVLVGVGSAAIGGLVALPGATYVIDPLLRESGEKGRWLRVAKLESIGEGHPVSVPVIGEQVDGWTRSPQVRLGMVWLQRRLGRSWC